MRWVVDAGVAVKWLVDEAQSELARHLLRMPTTSMRPA